RSTNMKKAGIFAIAAMLLVAFMSTANAQETAPISVSQVHADGFQWGYVGANIGIGMTDPIRNSDTTSVMIAKGVIGFGSDLDWVGNEIFVENITFSDDVGGEIYTQSVINLGFNIIVELMSNQKLDKIGNINYTGLGVSFFAGGYLQMFSADYDASGIRSVDDQPFWANGGLIINYPLPIEQIKDWFSFDAFFEFAVPVFMMSEDEGLDDLTYINFVGESTLIFGFMLHFTPNFLATQPDRRWHVYAGVTINMLSGEDDNAVALPQIMVMHFGFHYGW
ncbi:MAG: hypothetical protein K8S87_01635, partial [Planctomycetes bacterium]|nr:hypothetical protein [Planctomycetota bacterium]